MIGDVADIRGVNRNLSSVRSKFEAFRSPLGNRICLVA